MLSCMIACQALGCRVPLMQFTKCQVEISKSYGKVEWREDLKRILRRAGGEAKNTVFLFSDTQIKNEAFVEDINNLLNSGEVPNMFPTDEKMQARTCTAMQAVCLYVTYFQNLYSPKTAQRLARA